MRAIAELGGIPILPADTAAPTEAEPSEKFACVLDKAGKTGRKTNPSEEKCSEEEKNSQSDTIQGQADIPENGVEIAAGQGLMNTTMPSAADMPVQQVEIAAMGMISADSAEADTAIPGGIEEAGSVRTDVLVSKGTKSTDEADDFIATVTKNLDNTLNETVQVQQTQDATDGETDVGGPTVVLHMDSKQNQTSAGGGGQEKQDSAGNTAVKEPKATEFINIKAAGLESFALNTFGKTDGNNELITAVEKAIDRFAFDLQTVHVESDTITLALEPEELGHMSITVTSRNGELSAKIVTDNKAAASILQSNLEYYIQSLQGKGVNLGRAEILYGQLGSGNQHSRNWNGNSGKSQAQVFSIGGIESMDEEVPAMQVKDVYESSYMYYSAGDAYVPNKEYKA